MNKDVLIHLNIVNGSIWGILARNGLGQLTSYDGAVRYDALWANFTACLVLGNMCKLDKKPFVVGISTGFCGTLSSFSAIILDLFVRSSNQLSGVKYDYPNGGYGVMEFISIFLVQMGVSILGFHLGKHLAYLYSLLDQHAVILSYISGVIGVAAYIASIVLIGVKPSWRSWTFAILFAPWGALLRYHLARFNNTKYPKGTLLANVIGSTLIAIFTLLSRARTSESDTSNLIRSQLSCQVLQGLIGGFCGALTTISTFVSELFALPTKRAYSYTITSYTISFIIVLLILGPYSWTIGLNSPVC